MGPSFLVVEVQEFFFKFKSQALLALAYQGKDIVFRFII
jgi:hypothetical protein